MPTIIDLSSLGAAGFIVQGDAAGDNAGLSVSSAGDVNGDGYEDIIVGAPFGDNGGADAGEAYVIFGKASGFGNIDLSSLGSQGFIIQGDTAVDTAGYSVASAGDVNGDGFDDLIVGARFGDDGGGNAGEAYVIFGKASGFGNIDLSSLGSQGFIIQGDAIAENAGWSVASAGDINGDGYDDVIVGAPYSDAGGYNTGEAYVVFGKKDSFGTVAVSNLGSQGFIIQGNSTGAGYGDRAGRSVSSAGDVNGDGFDDLIVGARGGNGGGTFAGEAYVIFGKASGFGNIDLANLGSQGFVIQGDAAYDNAGWSVSSAGDVNGDGFDDLIAGAFAGDDGGSNAGEAYVIFGKASGFGTVDLTNLGSQGFIIQGDADGDQAGISVSAAGDVNGDGFDDVIVGANSGDDGGADAGEAYVIFGKASGFGTIDLANLASADGFVIQGDAAYDNAGTSVSSADVNGDGFTDVIVGARNGDNGGADAGEAYVIFGLAPTTAVTRIGSVGGQTIRGGAFADTLDGREGNDMLFGGGGNDTLIGGTGNDIMNGGGGNDTYFADSAADLVIETPGQGDDTILASATYLLAAGISVETLIVNPASGTAAIALWGNEIAQSIYGNEGANQLLGLGGNDQLVGNGGNDVLVGGGGIDYLRGGLGNDVYGIGEGDIILEVAGEGDDSLAADIGSYFLNEGASIETLSTANQASTSAQNLTGNELGQTVAGSQGANVLNGAGGIDLLRGYGGADIFLFDTAPGASNYDVIADMVVGVDRIALQNSVFTGLAEGNLGANAFRLGSAAQDADDRIIYNQATGQLFFDADGNGAGAAVLFALVNGTPALSASDFMII